MCVPKAVEKIVLIPTLPILLIKEIKGPFRVKVVGEYELYIEEEIVGWKTLQDGALSARWLNLCFFPGALFFISFYFW